MILMETASGGANIFNAVTAACQVAEERNEVICFVFNETPAMIHPGDSPQSAYSQWCAMRKCYQDWSGEWGGIRNTKPFMSRAGQIDQPTKEITNGGK